MRGISKSDFLLSLRISLTYFIFWSLAIFISGEGNFYFLLKAIGPFSWKILFVTLINILLHLFAVPFVRTRKTKWFWNVSIMIILLLLLTMGYKSWNKLGEFLSVYSQPKSSTSNIDAEVKNVLFQLFGLGYFALIKFFIDYHRLKAKNQQLVIEKKTSELNYLKSQTNPHFLFNTLNNIYLLTREKSELAPDSVLRLAAILRYMLYETEGKLATADKEVKILEDYIQLEKMRYDHTLKATFLFETDNVKQEIPPLLMIPLVENAFKHGVSETVSSPFINISLIIQNSTLSFNVENSKGESKIPVPTQENIGLKNLRRQLELLFSDYDLKIENRGKTFYAGMFINLNSYAKN